MAYGFGYAGGYSDVGTFNLPPVAGSPRKRTRLTPTGVHPPREISKPKDPRRD